MSIKNSNRFFTVEHADFTDTFLVNVYCDVDFEAEPVAIVEVQLDEEKRVSVREIQRDNSENTDVLHLFSECIAAVQIHFDVAVNEIDATLSLDTINTKWSMM